MTRQATLAAALLLALLVLAGQSPVKGAAAGVRVADGPALAALDTALAEDDDPDAPLLSADMLVLAEALESGLLDARQARQAESEHAELIRATLEALVTRWRAWKIDDPELSGALINLLVDYATLLRFREPQEEFLLTFEKSVQIRFSAFYESLAERDALTLYDTPSARERLYATEYGLDLSNPVGRLKAMLLLHLLRSDPALAAQWDKALVASGRAADWDELKQAAQGLPLGRYEDLANSARRVAFADALVRLAPVAPRLPLLPLPAEDNKGPLALLAAEADWSRSGWLLALDPGLTRLPEAPADDPLAAARRAAPDAALWLARWIVQAAHDVEPVKVPQSADWWVECRPALYRELNRAHATLAGQAESRSDAERAAHHRRWQAIFGELESATPEQAHVALDIARLPKVFSDSHHPLMRSLALLHNAVRRIQPTQDAKPLDLAAIWWVQTLRAELPRLEVAAEPDLLTGEPPLVALPEQADAPPPVPEPLRLTLWTLRVSVGRVLPATVAPLSPIPDPVVYLPE